ncbi:MAG: Gfo/Idh/MocA family oxidoreductase [Planctomycetaceae bacterium]
MHHQSMSPLFTDRHRKLSSLMLLFALLSAGIAIPALSAYANPTVADIAETPGKDAPPQETPKAKSIAKIGSFPNWVTAVAFSPDGKTLAAGSYEIVRLWDVEKKTVIKDLKLKGGFARSLLFTRDGSTLLVGGYQTIEVWDTKTQERTGELKGQRGYITDLALSTEGKLASSAEDMTVRYWNLADLTETGSIKGFLYSVNGLAWSPDGTQIVTAEGDETRLTKPGYVKLWNVSSGELVKEFPEHKLSASDVAFTPSGDLILSTSLDEHVNVYDPAAGTALGFFGGHARPTNCVSILPGGKLAISGSGGRAKGGNEVKVWNIEDGEEFGTIDAHQGKVTCVAVAPDGKTVATGSYDKSVGVWDISPMLERAATTLAAADTPTTPLAAEPKVLRIGIIGLDTSHSIAFAKALNAETPKEGLEGCRVVVAYPRGSADIKSSSDRIPGYTEQFKEMNIEIAESIDDLLGKVDAVLLETNDGRPHFEQALQVLKAGKPVFVDKPFAASLEDCIAMQLAAKHYGVPLFSSSSLRWLKGAQEVRGGSIGKVNGCDTYSPCSFERTHPDLFWYGIHGCESLFTVMGTGCETVSRISTPQTEVVTGVWEGGRVGTFRGLVAGKSGYGGVAYGETGIATLGPYAGYDPLLISIVKFFRTKEAPVSDAETIELYAFMEAADESKRQGGTPIPLKGVIEAATKAATEKVAQAIVHGEKPTAEVDAAKSE